MSRDSKSMKLKCLTQRVGWGEVGRVSAICLLSRGWSLTTSSALRSTLTLNPCLAPSWCRSLTRDWLPA